MEVFQKIVMVLDMLNGITIIKPDEGTPQGGLCEALHNPPFAK